MSKYSGDIGTYLDPNMIDYGQFEAIDPGHPSWNYGIMGVSEVPLVDGRIAIVDSNGTILGYK